MPLTQFWPVGHWRPQPPQWPALLSVSTQAFSQRVCPRAHWHIPAVQTFPFAQTVPQLPQFWLVVMSTQAPLQRAWLVGQGSGVHMDMAHTPEAQVVPHVPQFRGSLLRFVQAPPSGQRLWPSGQGGRTQLPAVHVRPVAHWRPQPPQFCSSSLKLTQLLPHRFCPLGHTIVHNPITHCCVPVQRVPQLPQLASSSLKLTQLLPHKL